MTETTARPDTYDCPKCGVTIDNSKPFIRCAEAECPEKSGKSLLDMMEDAGMLPTPAALSASPAELPIGQIPMPNGLNPDTAKLVCDFATELAARLALSEKKPRRGDYWQRTDWRDELVMELQRHVHKGDPRDVAAYCAFAWFHGWSIAPDEGSASPAGWRLVPEGDVSALIGGARLARYLIDIIEGPFGWATCRSAHGMRLKDAPEYVAAYLGIKEAFAAAEAIAAAPPAPTAAPSPADHATPEQSAAFYRLGVRRGWWDEAGKLSEKVQEPGYWTREQAGRGEALTELENCGLCWDVNYFPSLEADPEFDIAPEDHYRVTITTGLEDAATGWGTTLNDAARAALAAARKE